MTDWTQSKRPPPDRFDPEDYESRVVGAFTLTVDERAPGRMYSWRVEQSAKTHLNYIAGGLAPTRDLAAECAEKIAEIFTHVDMSVFDV